MSLSFMLIRGFFTRGYAWLAIIDMISLHGDC